MREGGILASNGGSNANPSDTTYYGMIVSGDEFDLRLGHDVDYDNVESTELIPLGTPMTFDGTKYYDTGIKLFDEDKSFTLAIDFAYSSTASDKVLMSCAASTNGFMLQYGNGGSRITYGGANSTNVSTALDREIVVLRKRKGDNNLYIYASVKSKDNQLTTKINRTLSTRHESTLAFGCQWESADKYAANHASGTIYWAKLWMEDLGESLCADLAAWPREIYTVQAAGNSDYNFRMFNLTGSSAYCNCCFLLKNLMSVKHYMNPTNVNEGGWPVTSLRKWLNERIFAALPKQWQMILMNVDVMSTTGNMSTTEFVTASDKIWIPSAKEMNAEVNSAGYSGESLATFNLFPTNETKIKYLDNGEGEVYWWWLRSPGTSSTTAFRSILTDGYCSYTNASYVGGVCFGFCI